MRDMVRLLSTLFIWGTFAAMVMALFFNMSNTLGNPISGGTLVMIVAILALVAGSSTHAIWRSARDDPARKSRYGDDAYAIPVNKAKRVRPQRVSELVESLSDDEIYELEALLLNQQHADRVQNLRG